jgi:hypothetical protein
LIELGNIKAHFINLLEAESLSTITKFDQVFVVPDGSIIIFYLFFGIFDINWRKELDNYWRSTSNLRFNTGLDATNGLPEVVWSRMIGEQLAERTVAVHLNFTIVIKIISYLFVEFFNIKIKVIVTSLIIAFLVLFEEMTIDLIRVRSFETNDCAVSQVFLSFRRELTFGVSAGGGAGALASSFHLVRLAGGHSKGSAVEGVSYAGLPHVLCRNVSFDLPIFLHGTRELSVIDQ